MGCCTSKDEAQYQNSSIQSIKSIPKDEKLTLNKGNYTQNLEFLENKLLLIQQIQIKIETLKDEMRGTLQGNLVFLNKNPYIFRDKQSILQICRKIVADLSQSIQSEQIQLSNDFDGYQLINTLLLQLQVSTTELYRIKDENHNYIIQLQQFLQDFTKFQPQIKQIEDRIEQEQSIYTVIQQQNLNQQKEQLKTDIRNLEQQFRNAEQQIEDIRNNQQINQLTKEYQHLEQNIKILIKSIQEIVTQIKQYLISIQIKIPVNNQRSQFTKEYINKIYDLSFRKRAVEFKYRRFVRDTENERELKQNYSLGLADMKIIKTVCNQFKPVRGDGNCFYTAFGYQFLYILLKNYSIIEFNEFVQKILDIKLRMQISINYENIELSLEQEQLLLEEFIFILIQLRNIEDINQQTNTFTELFGNYEGEDCCLYGLSTIFLRNLSNYALQFHPLKETVFDIENLLIWETECDNNEVIIDCLGQFLNVKVKLAFIDKDNCSIKEYAQEGRESIILLIKPGHYNIGISNIESMEDIKEKELLKIAQKCIEGFKNEEVQEETKNQEQNIY